MKRSSLMMLTALVASALVLLIACGGGGTASGSRSTASSSASITTTMSDPTTCSAPQGPYSHIYVTVVDVKVSTNANAGDNDSSFVDLTPSLKNAPVQVDLLGTAVAQNSCFLATLGASQPLTAGSYQQIRLFLADNATSTKPANNQCGTNAVNCVVVSGDSTPKPLQLSSEVQTGIKIPSGQIGGGGLNATAGASQTLNIDFDACASIVVQGNGSYRLKPVLHAGEVSATASTAISGKVVDKVTNAAISGKVVVALEQKTGTSTIDRVVMQTVANTDGTFTFCPVPAGTYDVVVSAVDTTKNVIYATNLTVGVQPGNTLGNIPMNAQTGASTAAATLTGQVTSAGSSGPVSIDVSVSALQPIGTTLTITVPAATVGQQSSATVSLATAASSGSLTCPTGTNCQNYSLSVPAVAPTTGTFSASGTVYTAGAGAATYTVEGHAFKASSGGTDTCTAPIVTSSPVSPTAGTSTTVAPLAFVGCS